MTSQFQLYERTINGFLAALDQLGSAERSSAAEAGEPQPLPVNPPAALLGDRETRLLEDAIADIEQLMQQQQ